MIKLRNMGQFLLELKLAGTISATGIYQAIAMAPFAGVITNMIGTICKTTAGTAGVTKLDVNKNGTSVFSATTTQITFTGTNATVTYGALTTDPIAVDAGDIFSMDVDSIGNQHVGVYVGLLLDKHNIGAVQSTLSDLATVI